MPTIAFQNDGIDGLRVLSTMYFPLDEAKRTRLLCDFADQVGASITPGQHTVESRVRDSRPWAIAVSEAGWRGTTAGEGLLRLALLCVNDSGEPSMRKVVASLQRHAIDLATDPRSGVLSDAREDRQIPITEKSMWNYLAEYKSVCHLWAAHRILERSNPYYAIPWVLCDAPQFGQFLAHAEWFLSFGVSHLSRNPHAGPLLQRAEAWVPFGTVASSPPDLGEPPPSLIETTKSYRARR